MKLQYYNRKFELKPLKILSLAISPGSTLLCSALKSCQNVNCFLKGTLCTGVFLYVPYSFLLISYKFCGRGGSAHWWGWGAVR